MARAFRGIVQRPDRPARSHASGTQAADALLDVGPVATAAAFAKLDNNKAVGPDDIPAELLKAGGDALACKFAEVNLRTARGLSWPIQWRGGRLANIHKLKGDPQECDNSRGLLRVDHSGKGLLGIIKDVIDPIYTAKMQLSQHGAAKGRSTDVAPHHVRLRASVAALLNLSILYCLLIWSKRLTKLYANWSWGGAGINLLTQ